MTDTSETPHDTEREVWRKRIREWAERLDLAFDDGDVSSVREDMFAAVRQPEKDIKVTMNDVVTELRKWCAWPQGEDGAHGEWDESDWSTPDKFADALERGEVVND